MTGRAFFLDEGVGERRGVATLRGRPERLIIEREGAPPAQRLGARLVARVRALERASALAFVDLGEGADGVVNLKADEGPVRVGEWLEVEIKAEARADKGAQLRRLAAAAGPLRLISPGPDVRAQLEILAKGAPIATGAAAREAAELAAEEALEQVFALPGGGSVAVETTRALTAVDIDLGARVEKGAKQATRAANLAGLSEAARILRLKSLGGLVVIDLAGRGWDGAALAAAARTAFAPDNPGVALGAVSRFGTLELTVPRRTRPTAEWLTDGAAPAMALLRAVERAALADPGGRVEALATPSIEAIARPFLPRLTTRFGARLSVLATRDVASFEVRLAK